MGLTGRALCLAFGGLVVLSFAESDRASAWLPNPYSPPSERANAMAWAMERCAEVVEATIVRTPSATDRGCRLVVEKSYIGRLQPGDSISVDIKYPYKHIFDLTTAMPGDTVITFLDECDGHVSDTEPDLWWFVDGDSATVTNPRGRRVYLPSSRDSLESLARKREDAALLLGAQVIIDGILLEGRDYSYQRSDRRNRGGSILFEVEKVMKSDGRSIVRGDTIRVHVPSPTGREPDCAYPHLRKGSRSRLLLSALSDGEYGFGFGIRSAWQIEGEMAVVRLDPCPDVLYSLPVAAVGGTGEDSR